MILDSINESIEVLLSGAVATNQLPLVASYVDVTTTTYVPTNNDSISNDTTAVTLVAAPIAATQRQVKLLTIYNADTAPVIVTIRLNNSGTFRIIVKITLAVGSTLIYTDTETIKIITANGEILGVGAAGATGATGAAGATGLSGAIRGLLNDGIDGEDGFFLLGSLSNNLVAARGTWVPADGSSAGLSLVINTTAVYIKIDGLVVCWFDINYPVTANGSNAIIQGLPFPCGAIAGAMVFGRIGNATLKQGQVTGTLSVFSLYDGSGNNVTNAQLSGSLIRAALVYWAG